MLLFVIVLTFGCTHPWSSTFRSLLLSALIVDMSTVSCVEMCVLGLTFTGGLSTGTATYTGDWRPLTKDGLLVVKWAVSLNVEVDLDKGGLNLSIALGVWKEREDDFNIYLFVTTDSYRECREQKVQNEKKNIHQLPITVTTTPFLGRGRREIQVPLHLPC